MVIGGGTGFEEDDWTRVTIGANDFVVSRDNLTFL